MKLKSLFQITASICVAATLLLTVGCGGGDVDSGGVSGDVGALETKALAGDADAAFKAGELYAEDSINPDSLVAALKWFHVAAKLGNTKAGQLIGTLESSATGDQIMEAMRQADKLDVQAK